MDGATGLKGVVTYTLTLYVSFCTADPPGPRHTRARSLIWRDLELKNKGNILPFRLPRRGDG